MFIISNKETKAQSNLVRNLLKVVKVGGAMDSNHCLWVQPSIFPLPHPALQMKIVGAEGIGMVLDYLLRWGEI